MTSGPDFPGHGSWLGLPKVTSPCWASKAANLQLSRRQETKMTGPAEALPSGVPQIFLRLGLGQIRSQMPQNNGRHPVGAPRARGPSPLANALPTNNKSLQAVSMQKPIAERVFLASFSHRTSFLPSRSVPPRHTGLHPVPRESCAQQTLNQNVTNLL